MQLFRPIFISTLFAPLAGCAFLADFLTPAGAKDAAAGAKDAGAGVAAGVSEIPGAIVDGVSALESGGWTAALVVTALGLVKAGVTGWGVANKASKSRRLGEIAEGVKKANGNKS